LIGWAALGADFGTQPSYAHEHIVAVRGIGSIGAAPFFRKTCHFNDQAGIVITKEQVHNIAGRKRGVDLVARVSVILRAAVAVR